MKKIFICLSIVGFVSFNTSSVAGDSKLDIMITPELGWVDVLHGGKKVRIQRNQNPKNQIEGDLTLTSRQCPPHCIQPIKIKGIETVGELEVLEFLHRNKKGDDSVLVVDTRAERFAALGTIPGSVNIFGDKLIAERGANPIEIEEIMTGQFGVNGHDGDWNFANAKTLVLYCYGVWCGQASRTIASLVKLGYPKRKLKWYRGGMQSWESLGLTTKRSAH